MDPVQLMLLADRDQLNLAKDLDVGSGQPDSELVPDHDGAPGSEL